MKKYKIIIFATVTAFLILAVSFFIGETPSDKDAPQNTSAPTAIAVSPTPASATSDTEITAKKTQKPEITKTPDVKEAIPSATPEPEESTTPELCCTLSVRCDTILNNLDRLRPEKRELISGNGIILDTCTVTFSEGESVFDLLIRELKSNKIHIEFNKTPNGSAYIQGINNIYEFDCGDLSGWQYKINGKIPGVGCSDYILKHGDVVEWLYTCDMGNDL